LGDEAHHKEQQAGCQEDISQCILSLHERALQEMATA
jgi:hypothetical protein